MDLLVNDASLHGQFTDLASFQMAIHRVMQIREVARRHMRSLYCRRDFINCQVTPHQNMSVAMGALRFDERRAVMAWLSRSGPFWDDDRQHTGEEWYEYAERIVTDTAIGEAAHCLLNGVDRRLISLQPSSFMSDPIRVERVLDSGARSLIEVRNYWDPQAVEESLIEAPLPLNSWSALGTLSVSRFGHLKFAENAFNPLRGQPFKKTVAESILERLQVLERLKQCFDEEGLRTDEGHELQTKYFAGEKAWFSDESASNKSDFERDLTFPHPDIADRALFCPWHGKIKSPQYRIHFSWPVSASEPLYVVYVGPKITKR